MKTYRITSLLLFLLVLCNSALADVIYPVPSIITQDTNDIVIYFNTAEGDKGLMNHYGDVYAYTGVTTANGDWQYKNTWNTTDAKYRLEWVSDNNYKLVIGSINEFYGITNGDRVSRLWFVIHAGDTKSDDSDLSCPVTDTSMISTSPSPLRTNSENIEITFDASAGNGNLSSASAIYVHTGVITNQSTSSSDWKHASTWADNQSKYALTHVSGTKWKFTIGSLKDFYGLADGEIVSHICLIFRDASGYIKGHDSDIFLPVEYVSESTPVTSSGKAVTTTPLVLQRSSNDIIVTYDASLGNGALSSASEIYAHTGVCINGDNWQNASDWNNVIDKYKLTKTANGKWQLKLGSLNDFYSATDADEISAINIMFRNADGTLQGKDENGDDFTITVHPDGLAMDFESNLSALLLSDNSSKVTVTANVSEACSITFYLDDTASAPLAEATSATTLSHEVEIPAGTHMVIAVATNAGGNSVTKELSFTHRGNSQQVDFAGTLLQGANADAEGNVTFCLYAPSKTNCVLVGEWDNYEILADNVMNYQGNRYFWITIPASKIDPAKQYGYYFIVDDAISVADPYAKLILDPWNDKYINNGYTRFPNLKDFPGDKVGKFQIAVYHGAGDGYQWQNESFTGADRQNLVIYELHLRDFTNEQCLASAITKLDYLKSLGINAIELMPVMEFDGNNSWGYNPAFYFAPDKYYGDPATYKRFIDECHSRGIAVILDVVFNHATGNHPWGKLYWDNANNRPAADSPFFNATGVFAYNCFSNWKQESDGVRQYLTDVLKYWTEEYRIDGYRFDLVKGLGDTDSYHGDNDTADGYNTSRIANAKRFAEAIRSVNPNAYVILEALVGTDEENQYNAQFQGMGWKNMNNAFCEAALGSSASDFSSLIYKNDGHSFNSTVAYMESHDEQRLGFKQTAYGVGYLKTDLDARMKQLGSCAAMFLLTPGAKMIWEFGELGYDISGGCGDVSEKEPAWDSLYVPERKQLFDTYSKLIQLRTEHPEIFDSSAEFYYNANGWDNGRFITAKGTNGERLVVAFNPTSSDKTFSYDFNSTETMNEVLTNGANTSTASRAPRKANSYSGNTTISVPAYSFVTITNFDPEFDEEYQPIPLGIDNAATTSVSIYPNPTTDLINVDGEVQAINVYSLAGSLVATAQGDNNIDVQHLTSGVYIVKVTTPSGTATEKIVKK